MDHHFFHFSKGERIGIIVLMVICAVLFIAPMLIPDRSQVQPVDFDPLSQKIAAWQEEMGETENQEPGSKEKGITLAAKPFTPNTATREQLQAVGLSDGSIRSWLSYLRKGGKFNKWEDVEKFRALSAQERAGIKSYLRFPDKTAHREDEPLAAPILHSFDPNTVEQESLVAMGVPSRVANNWVRFLASGGRFRKAEDIQKIYGLAEVDYLRILPYAKVATEEVNDYAYEPVNTPQSYEAKPANVVIDINQATAEEWQQLRGIGPAFSKRIVNFRDKLGGFHEVQQVGETYGLPDSVFQKIVLQLRPSPLLRSLAINEITIDDLAAHPYIRFSDARLLVNYREEHGRYTSPADLNKLYGLEESTKQKILPYISFE